MKQLIEDIAKALVDIPDEVNVSVIEGEQTTVLELEGGPQRDLGKGDRQAGADGALHPHHSGCGGHETEPAFHAGDPGINL